MTTVHERVAGATADSGTSGLRPFRADIQGLRAVAVLLVLVNHAVAPLAPGGYVGVDVFFVISGFLISGHLVRRLWADGRIDLGRFYAARARRILPAALVTVVLTAIASVLLVSPLRVTEILHDAIASTLSVPNIVFAIRQTDYLAGTAPSPFQHFWSLGVEEQFYLVWPALLLVAGIAGRRSVWALATVVLAVTAASLAASVLLTPDAPSLAFFSPFTRAWEFGAGALVALAASRLERVPAVVARMAGWVGVAAILGSAALFSAGTDYPGSAAVVPVVGTALVIAAGSTSAGRGSVGGVLGWRPFQAVGAISYSLYLVHWPILVLTHERLGLAEPLPTALSALLAVAAFPLAWLMFRVVESPVRRWRGSGRRVLAASLATVVAIVGGLTAAGAVVSSAPLTAPQTVPATSVTTSPLATPVVPANIAPDLWSATSDTGTVYTDGCQQNLRESEVLTCSFGDLGADRTIALFGDSHAGRWFPALERAADELGYRVETYTKSGCRTEETAAAWASSKNASCSAWRTAAVDLLVADPPDVIVVANHLGPTPGRDEEVQRDDWVEGLTALYERLPATSRIVTLADTPEFETSPVLCLSSNLEDAPACAQPRTDAFNSAIREAQLLVADRHGGVVIDLSDYFCNATICPAVIGATLVYSDEHHVTATFSRELAGALEDRLRRALPATP